MIKNFEFKEKYDTDDLINIIYLLRQPDGCPWDREQTHESIKKNFIEETYEVVEAINKNSPQMLREELGDVLMQIVLHSQMESENNNFDFSDVVDDLSKKLIIRHPHVFGDEHCENSEQVLKTWDSVKMKTKGQKTVTETMSSVPLELPALMRAQKVQSKSAKVGFDWDDVSGAIEKIHSECDELVDAIDNKSKADQVEELGDLLFSCVNASRFIAADAEEALNLATNKFISRFKIVENLATQRGINIKNASLEELDKLWDEAKTMYN